MRTDWDHIEILKSVELVCARTVGWNPADRPMRALYRMVAEEHGFPNPTAVRSYMRRRRTRLGILYPLPTDASPGNWAAYRKAVVRKMLGRGLQLELFTHSKPEALRRVQPARTLDLLL